MIAERRCRSGESPISLSKLNLLKAEVLEVRMMIRVIGSNTTERSCGAREDGGQPFPFFPAGATLLVTAMILGQRVTKIRFVHAGCDDRYR